jgi:pimeloyl-ACP methyl ester carboxylesterase
MSASAREPVADVVVLLPGIMGSVLRKDDEDVWSVSRGALFKSLLLGTGPIEALALKDDRPEDDDPGDGVTADRLVDDTHMIPGLWSIDGYSSLRRRVLELPGVAKGENYFELPYDWRRDNRVAACKLHRLSDGWLRQWRDSHPDRRDARLVLVAHSMGGLVARYFLEVCQGWRQTRCLVTLGTPYRGSLNALDFVVNGLRKQFGPLTIVDLTEVVRSLTSIYQLLPTFTCVDKGDGKLVALVDAGPITNLDDTRVATAREFHQEIEDAVEENAKDDDYLDAAKGYTLYPIVGLTQPTLQSGVVTKSGLDMLRSHDSKDRDGDGRVMRESAAPTDRRRQLTPFFPSQAHASLQNDEAVVKQIQAILTEPKDALRGEPERYKFGLDVEDVYVAGREIPVLVKVVETVPPLKATLIETATKEHVVDREPLRETDDGYAGVLPPQPEGTYRLAIEGDDVAPVTDTFVVIAA